MCVCVCVCVEGGSCPKAQQNTLLWEENQSQSKTCLPASVSATLKAINFLCFPIIETALRILGTLPVTSCSYERSFFAWGKLKMYNKSTMCNERVSALSYIHVEIDPDPQSILEKVIALGLRYTD